MENVNQRMTNDLSDRRIHVNQGDTPTTGLNLTEAPSRLVRNRIRGDVDDAEFDA
jgi:hypothetical protein